MLDTWICCALSEDGAPSRSAQTSAHVLAYAWRQVHALLQRVLAYHHHLLFNQHQLTVLACCLYAVARVMGPAREPLAFRRITHAITSLFPLQLPHLFTDADIGGTSDGTRLWIALDV